ncbi:MAG: hypothetical protein B7Z72_08475, partial [Gemmatimonadetes bacterium 21-71-4]
MTTTETRRPAPGESRPYRFPRFQRGRLNGGMQLVAATVPKLPLVSIVAVVDAGAIRDPEGMDGLAVLTAKLLLEGTVRRAGAELVDAFEQLGASVDITADWDSAIVRLTVLSTQAETAIGLLREVLREPAFRDRDVTRLKAERHAAILQMRADPRELDRRIGRRRHDRHLRVRARELHRGVDDALRGRVLMRAALLTAGERVEVTCAHRRIGRILEAG